MDCRHLPAGRDRARNRPALKACTVQDLWASGGKGAAAGKSVVGAWASMTRQIGNGRYPPTAEIQISTRPLLNLGGGKPASLPWARAWRTRSGEGPSGTRAPHVLHRKGAEP